MVAGGKKRGATSLGAKGIEGAVRVVPIQRRRRAKNVTKPTLKDLLLAPEPRTEELTPPRTKQRHRPAPVLE